MDFRGRNPSSGSARHSQSGNSAGVGFFSPSPSAAKAVRISSITFSICSGSQQCPAAYSSPSPSRSRWNSSISASHRCTALWITAGETLWSDQPVLQPNVSARVRIAARLHWSGGAGVNRIRSAAASNRRTRLTEVFATALSISSIVAMPVERTTGFFVRAQATRRSVQSSS